MIVARISDVQMKKGRKGRKKEKKKEREKIDIADTYTFYFQ